MTKNSVALLVTKNNILYTYKNISIPNEIKNDMSLWRSHPYSWQKKVRIALNTTLSVCISVCISVWSWRGPPACPHASLPIRRAGVPSIWVPSSPPSAPASLASCHLPRLPPTVSIQSISATQPGTPATHRQAYTKKKTVTQTPPYITTHAVPSWSPLFPFSWRINRTEEGLDSYDRNFVLYTKKRIMITGLFTFLIEMG